MLVRIPDGLTKPVISNDWQYGLCYSYSKIMHKWCGPLTTITIKPMETAKQALERELGKTDYHVFVPQ